MRAIEAEQAPVAAGIVLTEPKPIEVAVCDDAEIEFRGDGVARITGWVVHGPPNCIEHRVTVRVWMPEALARRLNSETRRKLSRSNN